MAAISKAQMQKELVPGLNLLFGLEYKQRPEEWRDLYEMDKSERAWEDETKLSGFGTAFSKEEGKSVEYDVAQEAWTKRYVMETYALAFAITEEAVEDNLYVTVSKRYTQELARAMAYTKNLKGAYPYNAAFTSGVNGGDGVPLCSTAHPLVNGGTNSNRPSTGADLNETSLEAADIAIGNWTNERGLLIAAQIKRLIIPKELKFVAHRLLRSDLRPGTNNNDTNAMRQMNTVPDGWSINHFLTDTNAWFLQTDAPNGMKYFDRVGMQTKMEGDFDTGNLRYKARTRFVFGFTDPLGIYGSPGSS